MSSISIAAHKHMVDAIVRTYERDLDNMRRELQLAENDRHLLNIRRENNLHLVEIVREIVRPHEFQLAENDRHLLNIRRQLNMKSFQVIVFLFTTLIGLVSTAFWVINFYEHHAELVNMRLFLTVDLMDKIRACWC
jgi:hypothetical protein